MRILGVDPGSHYTGVGVIETQGNRYRLIHTEVLKVPKTLSIAGKLFWIYQALSEIILKYGPDVLALENIFYHKDIRAVLRVGEVRACAMLAASGQQVNVIEYLPNVIKKSVTGRGKAAKVQVQQMIKKLLNLEALPPEDGADALAVAICHMHHHRSVSRQVLNRIPKNKQRRFLAKV